MADKPVVNIADIELGHDKVGSLYEWRDARIGPMIGLRQLGISYSEVPPGKSACPFHNHHVEDEIFIILEGEGTYRFGDKTYPMKAGSVLGAPAGGPETAHQLINTGAVPLRYYAISNMSVTDLCEYPDSGKFGVYSRSNGDPYSPSTIRHLARESSSLDYWDGENIGEEK